MLRLAEYLQGIATFPPERRRWWPASTGTSRPHMLLGMTIFLLFPFSRLVHVWSGFGTVAYLFRPYQVVRAAASTCLPARTSRAAAA